MRNQSEYEYFFRPSAQIDCSGCERDVEALKMRRNGTSVAGGGRTEIAASRPGVGGGGRASKLRDVRSADLCLWLADTASPQGRRRRPSRPGDKPVDWQFYLSWWSVAVVTGGRVSSEGAVISLQQRQRGRGGVNSIPDTAKESRNVDLSW